MSTFKGFTSEETFTQFPDSLLHLLKEIEDLAELKVGLFAIWHIEHMQGPFRSMCESDFEPAPLGLTVKEIQRGLKQSVERGLLLRAAHEKDVFYFLNSPRGRLAAEAFTRGDWRGSAQIPHVPRTGSNVFKSYEENIGPLSPMIADTLRDAEETYTTQWIRDAIQLAVENNKRNWKYVEAILKRWKEEGRAEKQGGRDNQKDGQQGVNRKIEQLRKRSRK